MINLVFILIFLLSLTVLTPLSAHFHLHTLKADVFY